MRGITTLAACALITGAGSVQANTIFSNSSGGGSTLGAQNFFGIQLFHIQTQGGGQLETITVGARHIDFFGGATPRSENGVLRIYADARGTPDADNDTFADPALLIYEHSFTTSVLAGNTQELLTFDVTADNVLIAPDAHLWVGVQYENFAALTSYEEIGTIFDTGLLFKDGVGLTSNPQGGFAEGDQAVVFDMTVVPTPASVSLLAVGGLFGCRRRR